MSTRILAALLLVLVACDQATIGPTLPTVDANWRVVRPGVWQPELTSVLAFAANDVYASHSGVECDGDACGVSESQLLHYDGTGWEELELPSEMGWVNGIWGREADDLYAAGRLATLFHYDGASWTQEPIRAWEIATSSTTFFASFRDSLYEKTPTGWELLRTFGDNVEVISAAEDGSLLAVTYAEAVLWNGIEWKTILTDQFRLDDAVCLSATDAFLLYRQTGAWDVMHWDGAQLSTAFTIPEPYIYYYSSLAFAGDTRTQLYIVGDGGRAYRFDGSVWSQVPSGTGVNLVAGSVLDTGELVAVGGLGKIISYDGTQWQTLREAAPRYVQDFWAESDSRMIISDYSSAFVLDGASFSETQPPPSFIYRMSGYSIDDVYATSSSDVLYFDGNEWSVDADSLTYLVDIWAGANGIVYAVGPNAAYRRAASWERIYDGPIEFRSVSGRDTRLVAVGVNPGSQTSIVGIFDGTMWRFRSIQDYLSDAIITSDSRVLVAGGGGVYHEEGDGFVAIPPLASLRGAHRIFELAPDRYLAFSPERFAYFDGVLWLVHEDEARLHPQQALSGDLLGVWYGGGVAKWELAQ